MPADAAPAAPPNLPSADAIKPLAEAGDVDAQRILGLMYAEGLGIAKDYPEAIKWSRLAAERGDGTSQLLLGDLYHEGNGVRRDYAEAYKWYGLAAAQGNAGGQFKMGWALSHREGVPRNVVYSFMWYLVGQRAEGADNNTARLNTNRFRGELNGEQMERASAMAQRCIETSYQECGDVMLSQPASLASMKTAAEKGNPEAAYQLALAYANGLAIEKNEAEAAKGYQVAADKGHKNAQFVLGTLYFSGKDVPQNNETAARWWRLAAERGVPEAQASLGTMYFNGQGVRKDVARAYMWLDIASAASGDTGKRAQDFRDAVGRQLSAAEIADAKTLAARCRNSRFKNCE